MASRRRMNKGTSRKVKQHRHNASCKHNKSISLSNMNGKCYKNGRKISCSKFFKEERNVEKDMSKSMNNFWNMFKSM